MYFLYIIRSTSNGFLYKGISHNIEHRLAEHNQGKNKSTKAYIPWKLVYFEQYTTRSEARERENYFKSGEGREFLKQILNK